MYCLFLLLLLCCSSGSVCVDLIVARLFLSYSLRLANGKWVSDCEQLLDFEKTVISDVLLIEIKNGFLNLIKGTVMFCDTKQSNKALATVDTWAFKWRAAVKM